MVAGAPGPLPRPRSPALRGLRPLGRWWRRHVAHCRHAGTDRRDGVGLRAHLAAPTHRGGAQGPARRPRAGRDRHARGHGSRPGPGRHRHPSSPASEVRVHRGGLHRRDASDRGRPPALAGRAPRRLPPRARGRLPAGLPQPRSARGRTRPRCRGPARAVDRRRPHGGDRGCGRPADAAAGGAAPRA